MSGFHPINYGHAIKTIRIVCGMTQTELATASDTTDSYISYIESGKKKPSAEMLESIAKGLRVPIWFLVMIGSHSDDLGPEITALIPKILADYLKR